MPLTFVRLATNSDHNAIFSSNDANDLLLALFISFSTSADVPATLPSQNYDLNGQAWQILYQQTNIPVAAGNFMSLALYGVQKCLPSSGSNEIDIPNQMLSNNEYASFSYGMEWNAGGDQYTGEVVLGRTLETVNFNMNAGTVVAPNECLMLGLAVDETLSNTGDMAWVATFAPSGIFITAGPTDGASVILGWKDATPNLGTQNLVADVDIGTAPSVSGFIIALQKQFQVGGATGKQLTFNISRGPDPKTLPEGRAVASVIIDLSQQPFDVIPPQGINYPELTFVPNRNATTSMRTWFTTEFDLESVGPQGSRLSEVRHLIAHTRPFFGIDQNGNRNDCPSFNAELFSVSLLTNMTTFQTIVLGGKAVLDSGINIQACATETLHLACPANAGGMKFRLISLCNMANAGTGYGKLILNFTNFELPGNYAATELLSFTQAQP